MTSTQTKQSRAKISPAEALQILKDGNTRFFNNQCAHKDYKQQINKTAEEQYPFALILTCMDSRVPAEIIFDQGIGDIFVIRIAGNIINDDILESLEFACKFSGARLVVVLGHTSCGAVRVACDAVKHGQITGMLKKIEPAIHSIKTPDGVDRGSGNLDFVNRVAQKNMTMVMEEIRKKSPVLKKMIRNNGIDLVGAIYQIETGKVNFY